MTTMFNGFGSVAMWKSGGGGREGKRNEWRERLARFATSGQSVKEFCLWEGVSTASFFRWRGLLGNGDGPARPDDAFIEVDLARVGPEACAVPVAPLELRLDLGHGVVLTITRR